MEYTQKDRVRCGRCRFSSTVSTGVISCEYLAITGKRRSAICHGGLACTAFEPRERTGRKKVETADTAHEAKRRKCKDMWDKEKAYELYQAGDTDKDISYKLGVSRSTVSLWRNQRGLPFNKGREGDDLGGDGGRVSSQCPADEASH